jgi:hypothetical protein
VGGYVVVVGLAGFLEQDWRETMSQRSGTDPLLPQSVVLEDFKPQKSVLAVNQVEGSGVGVGKVTSFGQNHFKEGTQILFSGECNSNVAQALDFECLIASGIGVAGLGS